MSFTSHAQNFEDVLLWRALGDVDGGRYLDIGAQDPVVDSVSLAFYEAGWRGTHIEPTPFYASKLREARRDEVIIEAAVSQSLGPMEFHEFPDTGLSTGKAEFARAHTQNGFEGRTILVPTIRLDQLLEKVGEVHWMKIDVEGMEADVLESWGDSPIRPWILVIEATVPNSQEPTDHLWRDLVASRGYRHVHFDGLSRYFVHEAHAELESRFATPPNVFDSFVIARHHPSARAVQVALASSEERAHEQADNIVRLTEEVLSTRQHLLKELKDQELSLRHAHEMELIETRSRERQTVEEQLRTEMRATELSLRRAIEAASGAAAEAQIEVARLEERSTQLEDKLARAGEASRQAEGRLADSQRRLSAANRKLADARASTAMAQMETNLAKSATEQLRAECEREKAAQASLLAKAEGLMSAVVAEPAGWWQRFGQALGLARPGPAMLALSAWNRSSIALHHHEPATGESSITGSKSEMPIAAPDEARNPFHRANTLAELLLLEDREFIGSAYLTLLNRPSDLEGEDYYLERLRSHISKIEILNQIRQSAESQQFPEPLDGLDKALRRFRLGALLHGKRRAALAAEGRLVDESKPNHVRRFMQFHDEEFVNIVYKYYLERDPDSAGLEHYLQRLRLGASRQRILLDIARSAEARQRGRRAEGESLLALALFLDRLPLIGAAIAVIKFNAGIRDHLQDMRALQNHMYRLTKKLSQ